MSLEVVAIGGANIDLILRVDKIPAQGEHVICQHGHLSFGGSAANFATQSARLGVKTGLISCIGNDIHGQTYLRELSRVGVDTHSVAVLENQPTGIFVIVTDSQDQRIVMVEPGANRFLEKHLLDEEYVSRARTVHVAGGFPMATDRAIEIATTEGMILSIDPGKAADSLNYPAILRSVDLLFVNEQELQHYFRVEPSESALKGFAKSIPGIIIVKRGKEGAVATDGFEFCSSQSFDVPVVDTTGAGDAFAAGFVTAWTRSEKIEQALHMANATAALKITKQGAQSGQPTLDEAFRLLNKTGISIDPVLRTFRTDRQKTGRQKR
ncbi:MAG: hypothetical protein C4K49_10290 [Candidatus Thorarchaeota archaeon]|nr:MAG: hypothetical protein C4K49_10290 [Candidatus Thorarchaeota archaeon]